MVDKCHGVANASRLEFLYASDDEADLASGQTLFTKSLWCKYTDLFAQILRLSRKQQDTITWFQCAIDYTHQHHDSDIIIKPRIDNQRLERRRHIPLRWWYSRDHGLKNVRHTLAGFSAGANRLCSRNTYNVLNFRNHALRIS